MPPRLRVRRARNENLEGSGEATEPNATRPAEVANARATELIALAGRAGGMRDIPTAMPRGSIARLQSLAGNRALTSRLAATPYAVQRVAELDDEAKGQEEEPAEAPAPEKPGAETAGDVLGGAPGTALGGMVGGENAPAPEIGAAEAPAPEKPGAEGPQTREPSATEEAGPGEAPGAPPVPEDLEPVRRDQEPAASEAGPTPLELRRVWQFGIQADASYGEVDRLVSIRERTVDLDAAVLVPAWIRAKVALARATVAGASASIARSLPSIGAAARQGLAAVRAGLQGVIGAIGQSVTGFLRAVREKIGAVRDIIQRIRGAIGGVVGRISSALSSVGAVLARLLAPILAAGREALAWIGGELASIRGVIASAIRPLAEGVRQLTRRVARGIATLVTQVVTRALNAASRAFRASVDARIAQARRARQRVVAEIDNAADRFSERRARHHGHATRFIEIEATRLRASAGGFVSGIHTAAGGTLFWKVLAEAYGRLHIRSYTLDQSMSASGTQLYRAAEDAIAEMDGDIDALEASKTVAVSEASATEKTAIEEGAKVGQSAVEVGAAAMEAVNGTAEEAAGLVGDLLGEGKSHETKLRGSMDRAASRGGES